MTPTGLGVGLATGNRADVLARRLGKLGVHDRFDLIVTRAEVERGKPFPDVYLEVVRRLDVEPELRVPRRRAAGHVPARGQPLIGAGSKVQVRRMAVVACLLLASCGDDGVDGGPVATWDPRRYREPVVEDVDITYDVTYGSAPGADGQPEALQLDLYEPDENAGFDRPAIVFIHGGGFAGLDKRTGPMSEMAPMFARIGYVTVSINYRLLAPEGCSAPGGEFTDECLVAAREAIHDAQAAVRWLRVNAEEHHIDPARIVTAGESAGAVAAMGVGVWSEEPGESGNPGTSSEVAAWMSLSGGLPGGILVGVGDAPGLLFASPDDPIVPYQWSVESRDALLAAGVHAELITFQGGNHVPWGHYYTPDIVRRTIAFFYGQLRLDDQPPG